METEISYNENDLAKELATENSVYVNPSPAKSKKHTNSSPQKASIQ